MSVTFKTSEPFYHNFDLSVVIPFYRKMGEAVRKPQIVTPESYNLKV